MISSGKKVLVFIGNEVFIEHCGLGDLATCMRELKGRFSNLQLMLVVINGKRDPAYGKHSL